MKKAGGIIVLIAGIFGVIMAFVTLLVGGMGSAFNAEGYDTIVGLGWGGVFFSFLDIIFGSIAIGARKKSLGVFIIISSLAGAILGGTLVAIFMILSLAGGIVIILSSSKIDKAENIKE